MADLGKIRDRIRKLFELTKVNGCTEAEAMAAAEKAAQLMAQYDLSEGDIRFGDEKIETSHAGRTNRSMLWAVIAKCTNCAAVIDRAGGKWRVVYVGQQPGPQIGVYLHMVTERAVRNELRTFKAATWYKRRRTRRAKIHATSDFTEALINRLATRVWEIFGPQINDKLQKLALEEIARRFGQSSAVVPAKRKSRYWEAQAAGQMAGEGVPLNRGVDGKSGTLQIGAQS